MKMRKVLSAFLAAICVFTSLGLCSLSASAEGAETVYATTTASVTQGSYYYCYVYLDDLTDLSTLTVSLHYDASRVRVSNHYNSVACTLYDASNKDGCLQFSYIFDGKGSNTKTQLFYFYYQVLSTAPTGNTCFDIVVSDAYNADLDVINISGSRCAFSIAERIVDKSCLIYSSSGLSTSVKEEFTLSYRLSTYQIASGSFTVQYDPDLFEVVEITRGGFLENKVADVNTNLDGAVAVSFAGTAYNNKYDLVTLKLRTIRNVTESSKIKLNASEFYDLELNPVTCSGYTSTVNVTFDDTYTEDCPAVLLSARYNPEKGKATLTVKLEKDSHLGAGDFVLTFDPEALAYVSLQKGFSPTFFNVNDKNVASGILKFSIISLTDITAAQTVLTVEFDVRRTCSTDAPLEFTISGNGFSDSLTNPILLHLVDTDLALVGPAIHLWDKGSVTVAPTYAETGVKTYTCPCGEVKTEVLDRIPSASYDYLIRGAGTCCTITSVDNIANNGEVYIPSHINGIPVTYIGKGAFRGCSELTKVVIPEGVTGVGHAAFMECANLTSVTIPSTLKSIGTYMFYGCTSLTDVTIAEGVTTICGNSFRGCTALTSVSIPSTVTTISMSAFRGCRGLTSLVIPDTVTEINHAAFYGCAYLTDVTIGSGIKALPNYAFYNCRNLKSVTFKNGLETIGAYSFMECIQLRSVVLPDSVTSIGNSAFRNCKRIETLTLSSNLESIGRMAFVNCAKLNNLVIPASVTSIQLNAFSGCSALKTVYYCGSEDLWNAISIETNVVLLRATRYYNHQK